MGSGLVRYKAEVDFDGKELTRSYLEKQDFETLLEEIQKIKHYDEMETFLLKHGENIVDLLGAEIDRIEKDLRVKCLFNLFQIYHYYYSIYFYRKGIQKCDIVI